MIYEANLSEEEKKIADAIFSLTLNAFDFQKSEKEIVKQLGNNIEILLNEYRKNKDIINKYTECCRSHKAFCRNVRKYEKDVDAFNQGEEYKCNQFLNLLEGKEDWKYAG